ncbi:phage major capsid protein [Streptomyces sp. L2]|uniref:phage major capsid protein n=1 Tax=Streptomyces sp. L2 TaxID=2162665 RepID=UPI0010126A8C|nr:phage major capsid protein [Streptomyces sp. L2]
MTRRKKTYEGDGEERDIASFTLAECRDALEALHERFEGRELDAEAQEEWDALTAREKAGQAAVERIRALAAGGGGNVERGTDGLTATRTTAPTMRDNAMRTLERMTSGGILPSQAAEKVEGLVSKGSPAAQSWAARWAIATGNPAYERAFAALAGDPERGHLDWSQEEHEAFRQVRAVASEQRAMAENTGSSGGYLLPLSLDPTVILTSDGSTNPLRRIARVVQTVSSEWRGVTSAGTTAEWLGEGVEAADASPALASPAVPVYKASAFTPYSFEVGGDALGFIQSLQMILVDAADRLMATAYTTGSGVAQPTGLVTALVSDGSSVIQGGGTEALSSADPFTLQAALPPRFQARSQWAANLSVINGLRQMETTNGALKFPELAQSPQRLLNRPMNEISDMDGSLSASVTESNYQLVVGDFQQFVIADRVGAQLEFIPNLMGSHGRPTGERGALLWLRTGSNVMTTNAFRLLDVPTTA